MTTDMRDLEPLVQRTVDQRIDARYRNIIDQDLQHICRQAVAEELEIWAEKEALESRHSSPTQTRKNYRQHAKSAKQLPQRISRISESMDEESPDALPRHHMPPQSYVDGRNSVRNSDHHFETHSIDDNGFRFSADPRRPLSRGSQGERFDHLRETKKDRLRDYLKDKFRPPSTNRSPGRSPGRSSVRSSFRSYSGSKNHESAYNSKVKLGPMVSFGASENRDESSIGVFRMSQVSPPEQRPSRRDSYSFLENGSRARDVVNSMDKAPRDETNLRNRMSFGRGSDDNEEVHISSRPINYSHDINDNHKQGFSNKDDHMKSQKYMNNVRLSENKYMDVQDVITKNKKQIRNHL
jgi:hypothetical protein